MLYGPGMGTDVHAPIDPRPYEGFVRLLGARCARNDHGATIGTAFAGTIETPVPRLTCDHTVT
jgi:hypothetical protein